VPVEHVPTTANIVDVLDRVLDKGIAIDAWMRISLVGLEFITIEARVVVASIDTYLTRARLLSSTVLVAPPKVVREFAPVGDLPLRERDLPD